MKGDPLCELKGISKIYASRGSLFDLAPSALRAVDGVDLTIQESEVLGLVGESGCGKSTLGRLALGLERPSTGTVLFEGRDVTRMDRRGLLDFRRKAQMVFQDPFSSLNPRKTVFQILNEPFKIHGLCAKGQYRQWVARLLTEVGLEADAMDRYPHEFSGGQRQRIGLARALAVRPRLVVADEPTSALDVSVQAQIINLLLALQERHGLSYLFISHDLPVVQFVSHRVAVMYQGRLVEIMPREAFSEGMPEAGRAVGQRPGAPHHPYTELLLAAVPIPDPARSQERAKGVTGPKGALGQRGGEGRWTDACAFAPRCPRAEAVCERERPCLRPCDDGHWIACHMCQAPFPCRPAEPTHARADG